MINKYFCAHHPNLKDEKGSFREANFQKAMAQVQQGGSSGMQAAIADAIADSGSKGLSKRKRKRGGGGSGNTDLHRIVKLVMERGLNPVIIFSFSKKDCEKYALELNKEDYTDDTEKELISQVYKNAIESLGEDDRKLPQVEALLPLLKKGVGIHHGGKNHEYSILCSNSNSFLFLIPRML